MLSEVSLRVLCHMWNIDLKQMQQYHETLVTLTGFMLKRVRETKKVNIQE
jgi:hypothetical protein